MSKNQHPVFDTNALISALLFEHSKPGLAFRRALRHGRVLSSSSTIEELAAVLQREKFERYVTAAEREEFLAAIVEESLFIEPSEQIRACRDAKDNKFLELTVSGCASYIITGDTDLLILHPFRRVAIVTPAQFLQVTKEEVADEKA
jgi:uncharacterized protein